MTSGFDPAWKGGHEAVGRDAIARTARIICTDARGVLLTALGKDGQRAAIEYAVKELPEVGDHEILSLDVPARNAKIIAKLTSTPIIEALVPTNHDWNNCVTLQDRYDMMKRLIRTALAMNREQSEGAV